MLGKNLSVFGCVLTLGFAILGCNGGEEKGAPAAGGDKPAASNGSTGSIAIDGSSTVAPITKAAAEAFGKVSPDVRVSVGEAGTGAGMKKFVTGELEICDASRPISAEELAAAAAKGIEVVEIPVAYDGLTVVVNKKNDFAKSITTEELRKLWDEKSTIKKWKEINPAWPDKDIKLFGPTSAHGSFEYFTEVIVKTKKKCRTDYSQCTDYSAVSQGVGQDENGLGYLGLSYFEQNKETLNQVAVDSGKGPVQASKATILDGTYTPLSRVLAIYTTKAALKKPEIKAFLKFVVSAEGRKLVESPEVGYVDLPEAVYKAADARIENGTVGSVLSTAKPGAKIEELYK